MWETLFPYIRAWVSAASIAHSGVSIHLATSVISKKEDIFFPSSHETINTQIITCIWSKDPVALLRVLRTKRIRTLICMQL